jgi:phage shock protein A
MGLVSRFTDIVNANLNSLLDKAEQPEKMIALIIAEMEVTLVEVRANAAKSIAEQKSLGRQIKSVEISIAHWHEKAGLALSKGRDDLAKSALAQKHKYQTELSDKIKENQQLTELLIAVQDDAMRLQDKLLDAKQRQESLLLRQASAQVRLKVREQTSIDNIDQAMVKFERYQEKIDKIEAQVEAYDLTVNTDVSRQISALVQDDYINNELSAMKKVVNA